MESLIGLGFIIGFCVLCVFLSRIKSVPAGHVVIIDRRGHFHKKVRGPRSYYFNPKIDKITTHIAKTSCTKRYTEYFETYDDQLIRASYTAVYKSEDIEATLQALEQSRRSIDDVINCSVYNVLRNSKGTEFNEQELAAQISQKAAFDIDSLKFTLVHMLNFRFERVSDVYRSEVFKPHVSASAGPIQYMHN